VTAVPRTPLASAQTPEENRGDLFAPVQPCSNLPTTTAPSGNTHLPEVVVTADPDCAGQWRVTMSLPADCLNAKSALQRTLYVVLPDGGDGLQVLSAAMAGQNSTDDAPQLAAELQLLRAELDLLKRAFRRHCNETG
jgi:hypothetical protein